MKAPQVVARIVVFGLVLSACGEAAGPADETWDLEVGVEKLIVLGSCDGQWPVEAVGIGTPGEFLFQFTLDVPGTGTMIVAGTPLYPETGGHLSLALDQEYTDFEALRFPVTVPPGEVVNLTFTWVANEWDGGSLYDARMDDPPIVDVWSSSEGFSPKLHRYGMGQLGCRLQANVNVTAAKRGA